MCVFFKDGGSVRTEEKSGHFETEEIIMEEKKERIMDISQSISLCPKAIAANRVVARIYTLYGASRWEKKEKEIKDFFSLAR